MATLDLQLYSVTELGAGGLTFVVTSPSGRLMTNTVGGRGWRRGCGRGGMGERVWEGGWRGCRMEERVWVGRGCGWGRMEERVWVGEDGGEGVGGEDGEGVVNW